MPEAKLPNRHPYKDISLKYLTVILKALWERESN